MLKLYNFSDYLKRLEDADMVKAYYPCGQTGEIPVNFVCDNSKRVVKDTLFVCKGNHFKPEYLYQAEEAGATCYISQTDMGVDIPHILVDDARASLAEIADMYYNSPWQKLALIGVTGTKGKTTVSHFAKAILDAQAESQSLPMCGLVSTVESFDGRQYKESVNSTPESIDLQDIFNSCVTNGLKRAVCEVSSQALKYHRVRGVHFDVGVFTNIGEDHISPVEHPDFEDYFSSKLKLFSQCDTAVINRDCEHYDRVSKAAESCSRIITFGHTPDCDVYVYNIRKALGKTRFTMRTPDYDEEFELSMAGFFNVDNAAAAVAATLVFGVDASDVRKALRDTAVSGRMETYRNADGSVVAVVDYAHNAMSFETLFSFAKLEYPDYKLVSVFGCVGNKAEVRRYALGKIAGKYCDYVYITSEHPDFEDPLEIAKQIAVGVSEGGVDYRVITDREQAVITAIKEAEPKTLVLILGVGDETTQRINGVLYPRRSDSECALLALSGDAVLGES